jgi:hypothetical protein
MDYPVLNKAPNTADAYVPHFLDANGNANPASLANPLPTGRQSVIVSVTPTVTAGSAYGAGNIVGGLLHFTNCVRAAQPTGLWMSGAITCKSAQTTGLVLHLFSQNPIHSTWTDKSAPNINVADLPYYLGSVLTSPDSTLGTATLYEPAALFIVVQSASTDLYGILTCVTTPTFGTTSDLSISIGIQQD